MTEDLPTPPLPEATITTRVVGPTEVSSSRWETFQRALAIAEVFSSWVISVHSMRTFSTPGAEPDPGADVLLDLRPQGAAARW